MTAFALSGLNAPASIAIDRWGMAHIRAETARDAFFVQGFNAARDRLWQIDLWRKRGLGLLAADFGPGYLMQDRAARLLLFRGDMAAEWAAYGSDSREICTAFSEGINAAIDQVLAGALPMPPEFTRMQTRPAHWAPEDVVRIRTHCLTRNAGSELARSLVHRMADPEVDLLRWPLAPDVPEDEWQVADPAILPADALAVMELATAPVTFSPERLAARLDEAALWSGVDAAQRVRRREATEMEGSNNWAIAPAHTASGRAIMASDPHRAHAAPSLRYMVHLTAPGMDLIGAGEPSSPGIMMGHNGTASFSLTIFCADQEDVMVYRTDPEAPRRYLHDGGYAEMHEISETFAVRGAPDQRLTLRFTRHGPVIHEDPARGLALALRTVFSEPGTAPYLCSLKSMRSQTMDDFRAAVTTWGAPSVNLIYADTAGDICWQPAAYVPRREGWRGLLPVAGDGRHEWQGFLTAADLPARINPDCGFVHSANEMNLPGDWDHDAAPIGYEWFQDGRADRIAARIAAGAARDLAGNRALQTDTHSALAARMLAMIPDSAPEPARALLGEWNACSEAGSAAALLYEMWFSGHLRPALLARVAPDPALRALLHPGNSATVVRLLEGAHPGLARRAGVAAPADRAALLADTLASAWREASERFGADSAAWRWGDLHKGYFNHALTPLGATQDAGPVAKGGGATSVMLAHYDAADYRVTIGASVRMVVDVGAWDNSVWINAPGQSGLPDSPHYADLMPLWARGDYVPMPYTRAAVDAATVALIELRPAG
ncbi:MAG: penicillin acylase family protein [Rhodobacteraceae bacterium]|nr:penicillin acylase family protein [Paracoccaceae bacterium]